MSESSIKRQFRLVHVVCCSSLLLLFRKLGEFLLDGLPPTFPIGVVGEIAGFLCCRPTLGVSPTFLRSIGDLEECKAVACNENGNVWVVANSTVQILDEDGKLLFEMEKPDKSWDSDFEFINFDCASAMMTDATHVAVVDLQGHCRRRFQVADSDDEGDEGDELVEEGLGGVASDDLYFFVADRDRKCVKKFGYRGGFAHCGTFGGQEAGDGKLEGVGGIDVHFDEVFVVDSCNGCVVVNLHGSRAHSLCVVGI